MEWIFVVAFIVILLAVHYLMNRIEFVCWFSSRFYDLHDYLNTKGGDGIPSHWHDYHCWNCGKEFQI